MDDPVGIVELTEDAPAVAVLMSADQTTTKCAGIVHRHRRISWSSAVVVLHAELAANLIAVGVEPLCVDTLARCRPDFDSAR